MRDDVEVVAVTIALAFALSLVLGILYVLYIRKLRISNLARRKSVIDQLSVEKVAPQTVVGFFHPYCNAGGGGELVLWTAIKFIQSSEPDIVSVVYTGDGDATKEEIIAKVNARFNIALDPSSLHFVFLKSRKYIEDKTWRRFTLAGQSLGSMYLAWEAMTLLIPDIFIDTMGYAFTFHVVRALGAVPVAAYVHYPTISSDMLERVKLRKKWHTNSGTIASSPLLSYTKLLYYRLFAFFYAFSLRKASFLMVNSTWTKNHVDSILSHSQGFVASIFSRLLDPTGREMRHIDTRVVYPPCNSSIMSRMELEDRERLLISIAQFRPEKDHPMQLHALQHLFETHPQYREGPERVDMVLLGGSRNDEDAARVVSLRNLANELGIADNVTFIVNADYLKLVSLLSNALIGINTMCDEHFGVNVVEYMASGLIPIVHASGGPFLDIVVPLDGEPTGFHATDAATFARAFADALALSPAEDLAMRGRARKLADRKFSVAEFQKGWRASGWSAWLRGVRAERDAVRARAEAEAKKNM